MKCQRGKSFEVAKGNSLTESSYIRAVANTEETLGAQESTCCDWKGQVVFDKGTSKLMLLGLGDAEVWE